MHNSLTQDPIYSVSQLNSEVRRCLEQTFATVWLSGEISNFTQPVSGHWYLTLKDEHAQVRCAMFRMNNQRVTFRPQNGMQVLVRVKLSLYEPRGDYQLIIESMQPAGDGLLQQQFEQLKMQLAAEGLFAQQYKKTIPHFNQTIGIITSKSGAALQDILHILKRRDPSLAVIIYPTLVQGKEASAEIVNMIELANQRNEVDVLIVGRGGGSLEDLWCFNEVSVAQAIFNSTIPIISAVGHETDVTIADFVADLRAPTPSAAAELVSRDQGELLQRLSYAQQNLVMALDRQFERYQQQLVTLILRLQHQHPQKYLKQQQSAVAQFQHRLVLAFKQQLKQQEYQLALLISRLQQQHPQRYLKQQLQIIRTQEQRLKQLIQRQLKQETHYWIQQQQRLAKHPLKALLAQKQQQLDHQTQQLNYLMKNIIKTQQQQFALYCEKLHTLSPLAVLARGYSITQNAEGIAVTHIEQLKPDQLIYTRLHQGQVLSRVVEIKLEK